ncbi:methyltransferase domain-containing protein [bacterium]|nr:methyltransferase domain-containing protein [bacterium]
MNIKQLLYGISTYLPGLSRFHSKGTSGTNSARYCYAVWMRHLVMANKSGLIMSPPKIVGELGPGDSIGIGLAALLSGAEMYYGMDVVEHASLQQNIKILDELVDLFRRRENIPDEREFINLRPHLDSYKFPSQLLTDDGLASYLSEGRIKQIRNSLEDCNSKMSMIRYAAPWYSANLIEKESFDMIYSQAVVEHVDDLRGAYQAMCLWLKPKGFISHRIDFKCHGLADSWNGHWTFSDLTWRLMRGRRAYLLNREPHSTHTKLLREAGFEIVCDEKIEMPSKIRHEQLAAPFKNMLVEDMVISGAFVQAVKSRDPNNAFNDLKHN